MHLIFVVIRQTYGARSSSLEYGIAHFFGGRKQFPIHVDLPIWYIMRLLAIQNQWKRRLIFDGNSIDCVQLLVADDFNIDIRFLSVWPILYSELVPVSYIFMVGANVGFSHRRRLCSGINNHRRNGHLESQEDVTFHSDHSKHRSGGNRIQIQMKHRLC